MQRHWRIIPYLIFFYIILAFGWWTYLLLDKNQELYDVKVSIQKDKNIDEEWLDPNKAYEEYWRKRRMIIAEGLVLLLTVIAGLFAIIRSYRQQVKAVNQQRNFLLAISHELKSPLASIQLIFDTLLRRNKALAPEKSEELINNGQEEARRLHQLVNDLLFAAKVETSYQPYFQHTDITQVIEEAASRIRIKYPDAKVHYADSDAPLSVTADTIALQTAVFNILDNAIKYSPAPAEVIINSENQDKYVVLRIADRGFGIPAEERKQVLKKFYRIGEEERRKTQGTGLGLYIVNRIIKAHKGDIAITDNAPNGTIFEIKIPKNL